MSNLVVRTITGFFFVLALVGAILGGIYPFFGLLFFICIASNWELLQLFKQKATPVQIGYGVAASGVFFLLNTAVILNFLTTNKYLWFFLPVVMLSFIFELYRKHTQPFLNLAYTWISVGYLTTAYLLLSYIAVFDDQYQKLFLLSTFILIWINDTFAFLAGRWLGKHQLFKRISPNKTWEGSVGGAIATLTVAYFLSSYLHITHSFDWWAIALIVIVFGTFGDLLISMLKRQFDLKDAGQLLPGHGGILDRFDALLFIVPALYTYITFTY